MGSSSNANITNATIPTALALDTGATADVTADGVATLTVNITGANNAVDYMDCRVWVEF